MNIQHKTNYNKKTETDFKCPNCGTSYSAGLVVEKIGGEWKSIYLSCTWVKEYVFQCSECHSVFKNETQ